MWDVWPSKNSTTGNVTLPKRDGKNRFAIQEKKASEDIYPLWVKPTSKSASLTPWKLKRGHLTPGKIT